ncbi:hypothetical protein APX70_200101 [Pseudomonas syringae pv. maculicola]|uniref:Uncharacterized protein n=1 Tax=Pseudomonas syringae pv. maculicola TaxID=59511 RepID=A0A3M2WZN2_PSEYM|nr:hypothetical protein APX70_200101 [Pseudomonas syringae pv. maculicola]
MPAHRVEGRLHTPTVSFSNWSVRALIFRILVTCSAMQ